VGAWSHRHFGFGRTLGSIALRVTEAVRPSGIPKPGPVPLIASQPLERHHRPRGCQPLERRFWYSPRHPDHTVLSISPEFSYGGVFGRSYMRGSPKTELKNRGRTLGGHGGTRWDTVSHSPPNAEHHRRRDRPVSARIGQPLEHLSRYSLNIGIYEAGWGRGRKSAQ
jgi:hypothetical protein